jgi:hypothetical protein
MLSRAVEPSGTYFVREQLSSSMMWSVISLSLALEEKLGLQ